MMTWFPNRMNEGRLLLLTTAATTAIAAASAASAQEWPATATSAVAGTDADAANQGSGRAFSSTNPELIVSGRRTPLGGGAMSPVDLPKSASIISEAFIKDQASGANPFGLLSLAPGINTNGRGSTGLDRGQISIRGFQSNQLGLSLDGVPINDSGTFNTFPHEYVDAENLSQIFVLQGAGDAETPNIGATGGVIGMTVRKPSADFHVSANFTIGETDFKRSYLRVDTGDFGGNRAFIAYSHSTAGQWRGVGSNRRDHIDASFEHDIGGGSTLSASVFYNRQNMPPYQAMTKDQISQLGYYFNTAPTFAATAAGALGTAQNDNNSATVGSQLQRSNFWGLQRSVFENVIVSTKANLNLADNLHLDIQPYLWFGRGPGGGVGTYVAENNTALLGSARDINGDGDTLDTRLYSNPYDQKQYRPGVIARAKLTTGAHELIAGFHFERADLHEWRPFIEVDSSTGFPVSTWADDQYETLRRADGSIVRNQDQRTITTTVRPFAQDVIHLADDKLLVTVGAQFPIVTRHGTNYLPVALRTSAGVAAPEYVRTQQKQFLPNAGVVWHVTPVHSLFASAVKTFRATDNAPLFQAGTDFSTLKPETAVDIEAGYRYAGPLLNGLVTYYHIDYRNRQQSVYDVTVSNTVARNIGDVRLQGVEAELGTKPIHHVSVYASGSYNESKLLDDLPVGVAGQTTNAVLPTRGKTLTDVPKFTVGGFVRYDTGRIYLQSQFKYNGLRYSTLTNDEKVPGYTTVDLAAGYNLPQEWTGRAKVGLSVNVSNLFDKRYLGAINYGRNAVAVNGIAANGATYFQGAPRFTSVRIRVDY
jgi:iron complex outermembrane receptor protein